MRGDDGAMHLMRRSQPSHAVSGQIVLEAAPSLDDIADGLPGSHAERALCPARGEGERALGKLRNGLRPTQRPIGQRQLPTAF